MRASGATAHVRFLEALRMAFARLKTGEDTFIDGCGRFASRAARAEESVRGRGDRCWLSLRPQELSLSW